MNSIEIKDVRNFMSHLLVQDTFDKFTVSEATVKTFVTYTLDGTFERDFFTKEENESEGFPTETYVKYGSVRNFFYEIIKGKRTPTYIHIVFHAPEQLISWLLEKSDTVFTVNDINSLIATVSFKDGLLTIITGINYRVFSTDKSLDQAWDDFFRKFLGKKGIEI